MNSSVEFIHLSITTVLADSMTFSEANNRSRTSYTLTPHFLLAKFQKSLQSTETACEGLDLSCLRYVTSGEESNLVDTVSVVTLYLQQYGL